MAWRGVVVRRPNASLERNTTSPLSQRAEAASCSHIDHPSNEALLRQVRGRATVTTKHRVVELNGMDMLLLTPDEQPVQVASGSGSETSGTLVVQNLTLSAAATGGGPLDGFTEQQPLDP